MGIVSLEQTDRLYWLGRYTERVYTTTRLFFSAYDSLLDDPEFDYRSFCKSLEIPVLYKDKDDFVTRYPFDRSDDNSLFSNLLRAHDNAIVLRDEIGSESLGYLEMSIHSMRKAEMSDTPLLEFQTVLDDLMAFWGMVDDSIPSENVRNILKVGKRVERIDLYGRLKMPKDDMSREIHRLSGRVERCTLLYKKEVVTSLVSLLDESPLDYWKIVQTVEDFRA